MLERHELVNSVLQTLDEIGNVVLLGPRQCGKTTLARVIFAKVSGHYFDLEDPRDFKALQEPMLALQDLQGLIVIDEAQRKPDLWPLLRVLMDRRERPAQFMLLGSASPDVVRGASESLAGRVGFVDLAGFSLEELGAGAHSLLWMRGGFPRSYLAASGAASSRWRSQYLRALAQSELPSMGMALPSVAIIRLLTMLAHQHANLLNTSELARNMGIGETSMRRYLDLLEGMFLIRRLQPWHENLGKRLIKSPKLYWRDSGVLHQLLDIDHQQALFAHNKLGASFEGYAVEQISVALRATPAYFYATQSGSELDLFFTLENKRLGVEIKASDAPSSTKSMHQSISDLGLTHLYVLYPHNKRYAIKENITAIGLPEFLSLIQAWRKNPI
jgi:uncharacterized protein